jgi:hypothetical protein
MVDVKTKAAMRRSPDRPGGAGAMMILKGIGSLFLSLLYVIFFPVIGLVMLVMIILKKIRPSAEGVPAAQLGEVSQDGGEAVDESKEEGKTRIDSTPGSGEES